MKFVRAFLLVPFVLLSLPALIIVSIVVLVMNHGRIPLRSQCAREIRTRGLSAGIRSFMERCFVPVYKKHVQNMMLGVAGLFAVLAGLSGLGIVQGDLVSIALGIEFVLLTVWALLVYFARRNRTVISTSVEPPSHHLEKLSELVDAMKELTTHVAFLERRLAAAEAKFDHLTQERTVS